MRQSFPLAPMSPTIAVLTLFVLSLPVVLIGIGLVGAGRAAGVLSVAGALLIALFVAVRLWSRPTRFEVGEGELCIVWPIRRRCIPLAGITRVRVMDVAEFRRVFGYTPRIGVGGLWGVFGWLYSRHVGLMDVCASRLDGWLVIQRREGRPLVCTPSRPEELAALLPGYEPGD